MVRLVTGRREVPVTPEYSMARMPRPARARAAWHREARQPVPAQSAQTRLEPAGARDLPLAGRLSALGASFSLASLFLIFPAEHAHLVSAAPMQAPSHVLMITLYSVLHATLIVSAAAMSCCPKGSWDVALDPSENPSKLYGSLLTIGKDTPCYYTCGSTTANNESASSDSSDTGIIVFPDVWGLLPRTKSICDTWAKGGGHHVLMFDPFRGDTRADHLDDMIGWLASVPYQPNVETDVKSCIDYLVNEKGVNRGRIGAHGFCWGAWAIAKASSTINGVQFKAAVWAHPSTGIEQRAFDGNEEAMIKNMADDLPVLVMPAGNDDDRLKDGGEFAAIVRRRGGKVVGFPDMVHGWTTRGDTSIPEVRGDTEKALTLALEYFNEQL